LRTSVEKRKKNNKIEAEQVNESADELHKEDKCDALKEGGEDMWNEIDNKISFK